MRKFVITRGVAVWNGERYVTESVEGYDYDGPWSLAMDTSPLWRADDFRFYADTGAAGSSALADQNVNVELAPDQKFRLRVAVGETANASVSNVGSWLLQFSVDGGAYATVTTSTNVRSVTSDAAEFVDGNALTQALGGVTGSSSYQSTWSEQDEGGTLGSQTWTDDDTEYEFCLHLHTATDGQAISFRMLAPDGAAIPFSNGVPMVDVVDTGPATHQGSGTPSIAKPTASGTGKRGLKSTGTPSLPLVTASGTGKRGLRSTGTPSLPLLTSSGVGEVVEPTWEGAGTPSVPLITASGSAKRGLRSTGTPSLPLLTASGAGKKTRKGTGTPSLAILTASGVAERTLRSTGTPSLPLLTASGAGKKTRKGTGTPSLPLLTSSGTGKRTLRSTGTPSLILLTASGTGDVDSQEPETHSGSGTPSLIILTASGTGKRALRSTGNATLPLVTASGAGTKTRKGTGSVNLPLLVALSAAKKALKGSGAVSLPLMTCSGSSVPPDPFAAAPPSRTVSMEGSSRIVIARANRTTESERNRVITVSGPSRTIE